MHHSALLALRPALAYHASRPQTTNEDDAVYKMIETLVNNKAELTAVAPHLQEFSAAALHKKFNMPYHAGALKYFADHNMPAVEIR